MNLIGQPHCLPNLFTKTYDYYPASILDYMAYEVTRHPDNVLLEALGSEFGISDACEFWIPEFVTDRLVMQ